MKNGYAAELRRDRWCPLANGPKRHMYKRGLGHRGVRNGRTRAPLKSIHRELIIIIFKNVVAPVYAITTPLAITTKINRRPTHNKVQRSVLRTYSTVASTEHIKSQKAVISTSICTIACLHFDFHCCILDRSETLWLDILVTAAQRSAGIWA